MIASPKPQSWSFLSFLCDILNPSAPYLYGVVVECCRSPSQLLLVAPRLELEQLGIAYNELTRLLTLIPDDPGFQSWRMGMINCDQFLGLLWSPMIILTGIEAARVVAGCRSQQWG